MLVKFSNNGKIEFLGHNVEKNELIDILKQSKTLEKVAEKKVTVAPKETDFLYVRNRAVSAGNVIDNQDGTCTVVPIDEYYKNFKKYSKLCRGANTNGDFFSYEELENKYKTFIGKSAFVDHDNDNVEKARGIIIDAVWNAEKGFVELLKAVDKKAYPELARGIELGYITDTSMGCRCGYSLCSYCGNKAVTEEDFCTHILYYKGSTFKGLPVFEDNRDIEFFEDSFVTVGADPQAKILEKVANKKLSKGIVEAHGKISNKELLLSKVANEKNNRFNKIEINALKQMFENLPWS